MFVTSIDVSVLGKMVDAEEKDVEVWDGSIADSFAGGSGTEDDPYLISNGSELAHMSQYINDGFNNGQYRYYQLTNDIDLNGNKNVWMPIGANGRKFRGQFDGKGYSISNLYIDTTIGVSNSVGLFGEAIKACIKNLNIINCNISATLYVGGILGHIYSGNDASKSLIENCSVTGKVEGESWVGGILGYGGSTSQGDNLSIIKCSNKAWIVGKRNVGGIAGHASGYYGNFVTEGCINSGKVVGDEEIGGIIGCQDTDFGVNTIQESFNMGSVYGKSQVGGIAGYMLAGVSGQNYIKNCYNVGIISGENVSGGIIGECHSYRAGNQVKNCYDNGKDANSDCLKIYGKSGQVASLLYSGFKSIDNCYCTSAGARGRGDNIEEIYLSPNKMKNVKSFKDWDFENTWVMSGTLGRPILRNNIEETDKTHSIIKDFSEYPYRADVQMDMSIPSSKTWKNVTDTESACKQIAEALDDEGMRTTAYWWKLIQEGIASVDNPEEIAEISFTQKDMYKAIIFNSLLKCKDIEFKDEDIEKSDEEDALPNIVVDPDIAYGGLKTVNKVTGIVTKWAKTNGELSLLEDITSKDSSRKWSTLSLSQQEDILKDVGEFYDNISGSTQISEAIKFLNKVGTIAKVCDTVVDCIEYISNYIYMYQLTDAQKAAVYTMYQVCPSDNQVLKSSLKEVYDILTSSQLDFIESITSGTSMVAGRVATATWLDLYWKSVKAKIVASCPYVMIFWAAIKTTTFATNVLLGTDDAVEAYYNMLGMKEFHSVAQAAYDNLQDVYVASESTQDAETYITATNILYHCIDQDYEYALNYLKPLNKSFINKVSKIFGRDSFDATMSTLKNYQSSASSAYNTLLYAWIYELENDYPEEYENYKKYLDNYETGTVKSYRIACPVDVYIYDSDDQLIGKVENNVPYVYGNGVTIVVENDIKTLYFAKKSEKYHLKLTGTDIGDMDIEIEEYSKGQVVRNAEFYDVPLEKELSYTLSDDGKILQKKEYTLSNENSGETIRTNFDSLLVNEKQKHILKVNNGVAYEGDETPTKTMEVYEGQKIQIASVVNNKQDFLGWKADDSSTVFEESAAETTFVIIGNTDVNITASYKNRMDSYNTPNPSATEEPSETAYPVHSSTPSIPSSPLPTEVVSPNLTETTTPKPSVTRAPNPGHISTPTPSAAASSKPSLTPIQQPTVTSPIPSASVTVKPSMVPTLQPSVTVAPKPTERASIPSAPATVKPSMVPTLQPTETVAPTPDTTATATPKPNIPDKNDSDKKNQIVVKGSTFVGSHGTALYKITSTGKSNTVSYIRNLKKLRKNVKIPASIKYKGVNYKVTSIGKRAFYQNNKLKKVVFGKHITQIGKKSFYGCNSLKNIKLNKKLSIIGDSAFSKCIKLQYIAIPKGVKRIGKRSFYGCKNLRYILVKSNQLTDKRVGKDSFAKGYKKVRVKTSQKKWRFYAKAMILKGKLSPRATFVVDPVLLILKK